MSCTITNRPTKPQLNQNRHSLNAQSLAKQTTKSSGSAESGYFSANTDSFKIGDRVWVGGVKPGIIAFIGEVQFAQGEWAGVVLDSPVGKNDGSVNGLRYFMCEPKRGIFSTLTKLTKTCSRGATSFSNETKNLSEAGANDSSGISSDKSHKLATHQNQVLTCPDHFINVSSESNSSLQSEVISSDVTTMTFVQPEPASLISPHHCIDAFTQKPGINSDYSFSLSRVEGRPSRFNISFKLGDRVIVSGSKEGIVRFIGDAEFAKGIWVGVELKEPLGKNDGSVAGKRYFQCQNMHGLFAPLHKVELCKTSARFIYQCQQKNQSFPMSKAISKSSSYSSNFNKGSQESISSIGSASSASRRMKLGVNSLSGHRSKGSFCNTPTLSTLQKALKEKEEHVEQLMKERDLDRSEFIKTAAQIDKVEGKLMLMQSDKRRFMDDMNLRMKQAEELIFTLEGEKNDLRIQLMEERRKYEDLQFTLEEVNIEKSEIQSQIEKDSRRLKELDEKLKNEMHLNDKLSNEIKSLNILGIHKDDPIEEYLDQIEELTHKLCVAESRVKSSENNNFQEEASFKESQSIVDVKALKTQLRTAVQDKLFAESQRKELEEDLKKVSAEKDLIELELTNLMEDHKKSLEDKEKLVRERLTSQKLIKEAAIQIKKFEQKVEKLTQDFSARMEIFKKRTELAEAEVHRLKTQQWCPFKTQLDHLSKQVQHLTIERNSLVTELQRLTEQERSQLESKIQSLIVPSDTIQENPIKSKEINNVDDPRFNHENPNSFFAGVSLMEKLKSEKEFAESQIGFLNAVIVDLQKRNDDLENQLKVSKPILTAPNSIRDSLENRLFPHLIAPRLFCDICDIFDQHDTEDCPMQNMTSSPFNISAGGDEERPYCTVCEVFGHVTDKCKDEQVY